MNLRMPGQTCDSESGLFQNYFRDYDPSLGRYVQSDPIGLKGGQATYSYALGNPAKDRDRSLRLGRSDRLLASPDCFWCCRSLLNKNKHVLSGNGIDSNISPGQQYEGYGQPVQIIDHSKENASQCTIQKDADEQCVDGKLRLVTPSGRFLPPLNQCQSFANDVVNACRPASQVPMPALGQ